MRVLAEQVAKDLLGLLEVALLQGAVAFGVSLLINLGEREVGHTGKGKTKYEGGHTEGRRPQKTLLMITLHDSHFLSDQLCAGTSRYQKFDYLQTEALLLQDFACLHGPENQIELVEIYTDVASEPNQLLLNFEVLPSR